MMLPNNIQKNEHKEMTDYITKCLDMGLNMEHVNSYTNSFKIRVDDLGIYFIPRTPTSYVFDSDLYGKIYNLIASSVFPQYTMIKQSGPIITAEDTDDIHVQRAFFFPWIRGFPERLIIGNLEEFSEQYAKDHIIPVMNNGLAEIHVDNMTSMLISGTSGGGKTYFLTYSLAMLMPYCDIIICDPKRDAPARYGKQNGLPVLVPNSNQSKADYVASVNEILSTCVGQIHLRQEELFKDPSKEFKRQVIVIDEVMAMTEGIPKGIKDTFFALLSEIVLLGRATKIGVILVSQRFDHTVIPVSVREQCSVLVQVGHVNSKTTAFLFPDYNLDGVVLPSGHGTGLIQIYDNKKAPEVLPLLCPTYNNI